MIRQDPTIPFIGMNAIWWQEELEKASGYSPDLRIF